MHALITLRREYKKPKHFWLGFLMPDENLRQCHSAQRFNSGACQSNPPTQTW
jgi:hypothetical protein